MNTRRKPGQVGRNRSATGVVLLLLALACPASSWADSMRCGTRLATTGDTKFDVLMKCGEPDYRERRTEVRVKRDFYRDLFPEREPTEQERLREPLFVKEEVDIEEWTYNLGSSRFIRYLTFENGTLVRVETGDYGY